MASLDVVPERSPLQDAPESPSADGPSRDPASPARGLDPSPAPEHRWAGDSPAGPASPEKVLAQAQALVRSPGTVDGFEALIARASGVPSEIEAATSGAQRPPVTLAGGLPQLVDTDNIARGIQESLTSGLIGPRDLYELAEDVRLLGRPRSHPARLLQADAGGGRGVRGVDRRGLLRDAHRLRRRRAPAPHHVRRRPPGAGPAGPRAGAHGRLGHAPGGRRVRRDRRAAHVRRRQAEPRHVRGQPSGRRPRPRPGPRRRPRRDAGDDGVRRDRQPDRGRRPDRRPPRVRGLVPGLREGDHDVDVGGEPDRRQPPVVPRLRDAAGRADRGPGAGVPARADGPGASRGRAHARGGRPAGHGRPRGPGRRGRREAARRGHAAVRARPGDDGGADRAAARPGGAAPHGARRRGSSTPGARRPSAASTAAS